MNPSIGWPSVSLRTRLMAQFAFPLYSECRALVILVAGSPSRPLWETGSDW